MHLVRRTSGVRHRLNSTEESQIVGDLATSGTVKPAAPRPRGDVERVMVDHLTDHPFQTRLDIDLTELDGLRKSIEDDGFSGVLEARHNPHNPNGKLQLVFGHRRLRAARLAGLQTVPVEIVERTDEQMAKIAFTENHLQAKPHFWDEALWIEKMLKQHGYSVRRLAKLIGVDKGYIENRMKLVYLPEDSPLREAAKRDEVTLSTLTTLVNISKYFTEEERAFMVEHVLRGNLKGVDLYKLAQARRAGIQTDFDIGEHGEKVYSSAPPQHPYSPTKPDLRVAPEPPERENMDTLVDNLRTITPGPQTGREIGATVSVPRNSERLGRVLDDPRVRQALIDSPTKSTEPETRTVHVTQPRSSVVSGTYQLNATTGNPPTPVENAHAIRRALFEYAKTLERKADRVNWLALSRHYREEMRAEFNKIQAIGETIPI
jgi:ParB/RepB/Spo0J family partition protein